MNLLRLAVLVLLAVSIGRSAVAQAPATVATNPAPRRGGFRPPPAPRHPVPILPALPAATNISFFATNEVPHGRVEIVRYTKSTGTGRRMHVYLPPGYDSAAPLLGQAGINDRFRMPVYFAVGETDIAYRNSMRTLAVFNDHGIRTFSVLSSHGHEWLNWRRYLWQTAQIMFPEDP